MPPAPCGYTFIEILVAVTVAAILSSLALPSFLVTLHRYRVWSATRYLSSRMAWARTQAVTRSAYVALRFSADTGDVAFQMFRDGNHNGVRTVDIEAGIDRPVGESVRLSQLFPGVAIGMATGMGTDPVRIGPTDILSFTPMGTATAGTIYVRSPDDEQLAIRVVGATARTRVMRYVRRTRAWVESF